MQGTSTPTFRPTVRPAEPAEVPPVTRYQLDYDGATCKVFDVARNERQATTLPPDFAIREILEAPDDESGLVAFMRQWGLLVDLPSPGLVLLIDLRESRHRLTELQALARHLIAGRDGDTEGEREAWTPVAEATGWEPPTVSQARLWFQHAMNRGLSRFSFYVSLGPDDSAALTRPTPNLYDVVTVQLSRYLSSDAPMGRCANDRCGRAFTVQRSARRQYDGTHHNAGVRYCSHLCARAQSERDRRARRRTAKEQTA